MANAAIAILNRALSGTLSASSAGASTPVTLLQNPHAFRRWLVASGTTPNLTLDMGASAAIGFDTFALIAPVASGGTPTMRIRVSTHGSGAATSGDAYDQASIGGYDDDYLPWVHLTSSVKTGRWVRFDFTNFIGAGILWCGTRDAFTANFTPGARTQVIPKSKRVDGDAGQSFFDLKRGKRIFERHFDFLSDTERSGFLEGLFSAIRNEGHRDVLWIDDADPSSVTLSRDCLSGFLSGDQSVTQPFVTDQFDATLTIEERL